MKGKAFNILFGLVCFIFLVLLTYIIITSIEVVNPHTVKVVREIGVKGSNFVLISRPLVNNTDKSKRFLKQPIIPILRIGYIDRVIDLNEARNFSTSFALYTLDEKTGKFEDREYVDAYVIEGKIKKVVDWEKFISLLDVDQANLNRENNPFLRKLKNRESLLAEKIRKLVGSKNSEYSYGTDISMEDEKATDIVSKIGEVESELLSRRNFILYLKDKYNFGKEEEYWDFIEREAPWYYVLGVSRFEILANQAKELSEYIQSVYGEDVKLETAAMRYISDEEYLSLLNNVYRAYNYERSAVFINDSIKELDKEKEEIIDNIDKNLKKYVYAVIDMYLDNLKQERQHLWMIELEDLTTSFSSFLEKNIIENLLGSLQYDQIDKQLNIFLNEGKNTLLKNEISILEREKGKDLVKDIMIKLNKHTEIDIWSLNTDQILGIIGQHLQNQKDFPSYSEDFINYTYYYFIEAIMREMLVQLKKNYDAVLSHKIMSEIYTDIREQVGSQYMDRDQLYNKIDSYLLEKKEVVKFALEVINNIRQKETLIDQKNKLVNVKDDILLPYFNYKKEKSDIAENRLLWNAAIREILYGEDLSKYRPYKIHFVKKGETLSKINNIYNTENPLNIFKANKDVLIFEKDEDQVNFEDILYRDDDKLVFKLYKNMVLKQDLRLMIPEVEIYSFAWWKKQAEFQKKRDKVIKQYLYKHISDYLPGYFEKYVSETREIKYLEDEHGIEMSDLTLFVEKRCIYSNRKLKRVNPDYIHLFQNNDSEDDDN